MALSTNQKIAICVPLIAALIGAAVWKGPSIWQTVSGNGNTQTTVTSASGGLAVGRDQITTQNFYSASPQTGQSQDFAKTADLQLETFGDERVPVQTSLENVWRWYFLRTILEVRTKTGEGVQTETQTLFITFDKPVLTGNVVVTSIGFSLPPYEVKDFTNRYAIIAFTTRSQIPAGALRVHVSN